MSQTCHVGLSGQLESVIPYVNRDGAVLGGDQAGAEALGHGGLKGHGDAV